MVDRCWIESRYRLIHAMIVAFVEGDTLNVAPGTPGAIMRAIDHFRARGESHAVARLEVIALAVTRLQLELRSDPGGDHRGHRAELRRLAALWLRESPMFPAESIRRTA